MPITLEPVTPSARHCEILYDQLRARRGAISHEIPPSYEEHCAFVARAPYRAWLLIENAAKAAGNIYIQYDNSIGLNNLEEFSASEIAEALDALRRDFPPLSAVKSVRYKNYFINVACKNENLKKKLEEIGCAPSQISYVVKDAFDAKTQKEE